MEGDETNTTVDTAPETGGDATPGWNGEMESLSQQEWYTKIPDDLRPHVETGLKAKWNNLETGYSKKFQALADERKGWTTERTSLQERLAQQERDALMFKDLFGTSDEDLPAKLEQERRALEAKYTPLEAELAELRTYKTSKEAEAKATYDAMVQKEVERMSAAYKDILADDKAADTFEKLVAAGFSDEDAASITRQKFSIRAPVMPKAVVIASKGDSAPVKNGVDFVGLSPSELIARSVAQAARKLGA